MRSRLHGHSPFRPIATGLLVSLAFTACVQQEPPGVTVQAVSADIAFGMPVDDEIPTPVPPPTLLRLPPLTPSIPASTIPPSPPPLPTAVPLPDCPVAGLNDFPEEPAATNVEPDRRPAEGSYTWYARGTVRLAELAFEPLPFEQPYEVEVFGVEAVSDQQFSYWTRSEGRLGVTVERKWQIRTDGVSVGPADLPYEVPGVDPDGDGNPDVTTDDLPTVGEPDRGLSLVEVHYYDQDEREIGRGFVPTVPLLLLPLPARVGEEFSALTTDPVSQQQWGFTDAEVLPVERVDACGDVVEGYAVQGTLQFVDSEGSPTTTNPDGYRIVVIPQMGGLVALEHTSVGLEQAEGYTITDTIGQLEPDEDAS